jgi:hypothetical protein
MGVISHQRPRQAFGAGLHQQKTQSAEKGIPIGIIEKNGLFLNAPHYDVLQKIRMIDSRCSWHGCQDSSKQR